MNRLKLREEIARAELSKRAAESLMWSLIGTACAMIAWRLDLVWAAWGAVALGALFAAHGLYVMLGKEARR